MNEYHLIGQFPKPEEGEYVPITFVEFKRKLVGWSPELKRSVYIENIEDSSKLKRIREVNVMIAINHLSGNVSSIELTDEERQQFDEVYNLFLKTGGQLMYTRKKAGTRMVSFFEVHGVDRVATDVPEKTLLSERI
jgi:hypothetical protein